MIFSHNPHRSTQILVSHLLSNHTWKVLIYNHALTARQMVPHETNVYIMDLLARTHNEKTYNSLWVENA
ncbi:hypothetical protein HanRHA438_Chr11g0511601 [Helianthus annuus]|uniref:Uncharacterized protein n=1 Tax=Helianthus annuus TaxID=4232 RepID=A0A9K3HQP9_HELAN|nr:hypothetical protein HanXRQr2_Chr11g0498921 [Helianthus annuus]KAJ0502149.1 hypothetical protein HanHA300_Chr11g0409431 [Helianthus annuus]KAJ0510131.1 hypothetical protein HanIR_Chr11g0537181 [Helianthus annuus]KAJ0518070.1 hypothetical protein HanHA89_Chr11g0433091 [Helianthus annuus]KAJ0686097.1 hypothetical protein HanLR1_Chr11g0410701 [Helianthus annuus]